MMMIATVTTEGEATDVAPNPCRCRRSWPSRWSAFRPRSCSLNIESSPDRLAQHSLEIPFEDQNSGRGLLNQWRFCGRVNVIDPPKCGKMNFAVRVRYVAPVNDHETARKEWNRYIVRPPAAGAFTLRSEYTRPTSAAKAIARRRVNCRITDA